MIFIKLLKKIIINKLETFNKLIQKIRFIVFYLTLLYKSITFTNNFNKLYILTKFKYNSLYIVLDFNYYLVIIINKFFK